jgi:hypothetical protein
VASVAHPEEIEQSNITGDQESSFDFLSNTSNTRYPSNTYSGPSNTLYDPSNTFITGGSFVVVGSVKVSLRCSAYDFSTNSTKNNINIFPMNIIQKPNSSAIFTGRQDVLDKLEQIFTHQASRFMSRRSCLLWGMGGIGKTQICLKFLEEMSHK